MSRLIADASALVSLGIVADDNPDPLALCLSRYEVVVPTAVIDELREIASYDDAHGHAASAVLDQAKSFTTQSVDLDAEFPLDDGENAAITLANDLDAALFLSDEFNQLGLIHASLADTRLVTTPTLLSVLVRTEHLSAADARLLLGEISDARSWGEQLRAASSLLARRALTPRLSPLDLGHLCKPPYPTLPLGIESILWVVSAAFAISTLPFLLFTSYILRLATLARQTLSMGPPKLS